MNESLKDELLNKLNAIQKKLDKREVISSDESLVLLLSSLIEEASE